MIDLKELRESPERFKDACRKKRVNVDIDAFLALDRSVRELRTSCETLRAEQNAFSKELPKLTGDEKANKLGLMKDVAERLKNADEKFRVLSEEWEKTQLLIPSVPLDGVPEGKDDTENVEIRKWGTPRTFDFPFLDHIQLAKRLDLFDVERGVKIAGARNYFLKGDGCRLQHAVLQLAMDLLYSRGYTIMDVPHIVNYQAMMGTSYFPGGEDQAYHLDERDAGSYLIGTAEVSVTSYHEGEILAEAELPKRYAGYSPCYRREAGASGKDTQGMYRVHQFYKVEQVIVCAASVDESAKLHAEILGNAEAALQALEIPYRVVDVCTGDMGRGQVYKNDIEVWMPSRKGWGESHSCSTFYDFQARRLNLRYKNKDGQNQFCHTLNNTCIASPRILIPILEQYQNKDGSITIPHSLRKYMNGQERIEPRA